jgi:hypothetical protein
MYQKQGGVWVQVYSGDVTPPHQIPGFATTPVNSSSPYRFSLTCTKSPLDTDVANILFAGRIGAYPTNPNDNTNGYILNAPAGMYLGAPNGGFVFDATRISSTSSTYLGDWVPGTAAVVGADYYWGAWQEDTSGNIGPSVSNHLKFPAPIVNSASYIQPAYSDSWAPNYGIWRGTGGDYDVYQGGTSAQVGMYFYGSNATNVLKGKTITKMQIYIYRINTTHGVSGAANVYFINHGYFSRPSGAPTAYGGQTYLGTLNRGQGKWFNVPTAGNVWDAFANGLGNAKGFGLYTGVVGVTSPDYLIAAAYNAGLASGRVYVEYHT